jgi:hypothetical protein
MCESADVQKLAECHAKHRRFYDRIWLVIALAISLCGVAVWLVTWNPEHLLSGFFLAIFPVLGLFWNHFILLNPYRDPRETQRRLEKHAARWRNPFCAAIRITSCCTRPPQRLA